MTDGAFRLERMNHAVRVATTTSDPTWHAIASQLPAVNDGANLSSKISCETRAPIPPKLQTKAEENTRLD